MVALIEMVIVVWAVVYGIGPLAGYLTVDATLHLVIQIASAVVGVWLIESFMPRAQFLRFLDPYFGHRMRRTVEALQRRDA